MPSKRYTPELLNEALESIQSKTMSAYKASKLYNIPKQTLLDKIHRKYTKQSFAGAPTILTTTEENLIVKWVHHLADIGFPVTKDQLLYSVSKLVKELNRPHKFKNGLPGRHWYEGFLKRNSTITKRVSQTLTTARVGANEEKIRAWFQKIYSYLEDNNLVS
uniref:Uncharacterized protein LOC114330406 n=1 Tax=Diabrotica virgifera virgifera TaxID=50390 RepID=A0A6P7FI18_DIAVI